MKVYTKTGDRGTTSLIGGERVFKTDERVEAYGSVDELTAFIALLADNLRCEDRAADCARTEGRVGKEDCDGTEGRAGKEDCDGTESRTGMTDCDGKEDCDGTEGRARAADCAGTSDYVGELNRILSRLMTIEALLATGTSGGDKVPPLPQDAVAWLEQRIDAMQERLQPIDKFTLPGGHVCVSLCHVCRTVCRRAERAALRADAKYGVDPAVLAWLNRLSDYFYLLGRTLTAHYAVEETLWIP